MSPLRINVVGVVVGVSDESWGGAKPGRRVTLFVQEHPEGRESPKEIRVDSAHYPSVSGLTLGVAISVLCAGTAWAQNGVGVMRLATLGQVELTAKKAA